MGGWRDREEGSGGGGKGWMGGKVDGEVEKEVRG